MTAGASACPETQAVPGELAGLRRRYLSLIYEALLLAAILLAGALPVVILTHGWSHAFARAVLQIWLVLLCGAFYIWQWRGKGQTLPMKTWRMRLVARGGEPVDTRRAFVRYAAVYLSMMPLGLGFLWAFIDRERQFLHDRIAGTRLVMTEATRR